ncbi:MAG: hypothetical protein OM95_01580 [Bdellovibrio sp. ArHS]|uniref:PilZ domain-containing protein n=1 Tax=Bdellovibrio sp. ArHS TaxID=1569284 RepID=UPI00058389AD|nr:PilZ domain-containing protein [Bdellovibrio sp. ArHS]KHD89788.1 MAG: hypothetical protein OM95_01580 [Bdellovibrio sp. ArHS]
MSRAVRFQPDPLDHALIDYLDEDTFDPTAVGIILNESFTGCALVVKASPDLVQNQTIKVKVGRLDPMSARVVWIEPLDTTLMKIGIEFLENL